jgi:hypothetical protein
MALLDWTWSGFHFLKRFHHQVGPLSEILFNGSICLLLIMTLGSSQWIILYVGAGAVVGHGVRP